MYSALAVDKDTEFCFLEDQDTRDLPRNWQVPEVDFLSTLSPALLFDDIFKKIITVL